MCVINVFYFGCLHRAAMYECVYAGMYYVQVYVYAYMSCICTSNCVLYMRICVCVYVYVYVDVYPYAHTNVCVCMIVHPCICAMYHVECMYIYMHVLCLFRVCASYVHTQTYTHAYLRVQYLPSSSSRSLMHPYFSPLENIDLVTLIDTCTRHTLSAPAYTSISMCFPSFSLCVQVCTCVPMCVCVSFCIGFEFCSTTPWQTEI